MAYDLKTDAFTLVLSGGGALGIAHLGVLHDLRQNNISADEVVGTSMGGIIGACLAIGMSEAEIFSRINEFARLGNWIRFSLGGNALIDTRKISAIFDQLFGERRMSDTDIPLKLVATRLSDGAKRVFDATDDIAIKDGLLATMAIPGIFKEHTINGHVYGDGFLSENLALSEASCKNVLAVDVLGKNSFEQALPDGFFKAGNVLEMFEKSMRLLIYNQTRASLRHTDKDVLLLEPDTSGFKTYQFHKAEDIRQVGLGVLGAVLV